MSVFLYCPRKSLGAMELAHALGARRLRKFDGQEFWEKSKRARTAPGDTIICWGGILPELEDLKILNSREKPMNKFKELQALTNDVAVVQAIDLNRARQQPDMYTRKNGWLPRSNFHVGGDDLLGGPIRPDFWVKKEEFTGEFRIHSFSGSSIRAGEKVVRDGFRLVTSEADWKPGVGLAHPWIRSFDAGWRINYNDFRSNKAMRAIAHAAVKALGLTFGAVDIGQCADGTFKVLEANTAPGIEGGSIQAYVNAIQGWMKGEVPGTKKKEPAVPVVAPARPVQNQAGPQGPAGRVVINPARR